MFFTSFSQVLSLSLTLSISQALPAAPAALLLGTWIPAAANDAAVFAGLLSGFLTPAALGALRGGAGATPARWSSEATGFDGCAPWLSQWRMRSSLRPTCLVPSLAEGGGRWVWGGKRGERERLRKGRESSAASPLINLEIQSSPFSVFSNVRFLPYLARGHSARRPRCACRREGT